MKEYSLNPGDVLGGWVIERHIANGCIYRVHHGEYPANIGAMKIRQPERFELFNHEISILKRLDSIYFQRLIDYSAEPDWLWLVTNLAKPDRNVKKIPAETLQMIDIGRYTAHLIKAFAYLDSLYIDPNDLKFEHLFITGENLPLLIDVESYDYEGRRKFQSVHFHNAVKFAVGVHDYLNKKAIGEPVPEVI